MIAYLTITTYGAGGNHHYYGRIRAGRTEWDCEIKLTRVEAEHLQRCDGYDFRWEAGMTSARLPDEDRVHKEAIKIFDRELKPAGFTMLLIQAHYVIEPGLILKWEGREDDILVANALWRQFEDFNGWGCAKEEEEQVQAISDAWMKLTDFEALNERRQKSDT